VSAASRSARPVAGVTQQLIASPFRFLHQHMGSVAELRFFALPCARQQRVWIGSRLVGIVAAFLAVKVHGRIAGIIISRGLRRFGIFALETLLPGPCCQSSSENPSSISVEIPPSLCVVRVSGITDNGAALTSLIMLLLVVRRFWI
jgi:hypothetical protein